MARRATAFWTLKALACAASLGCVAPVTRIARQLERPVVPAVLFVGLNPVLLAGVAVLAAPAFGSGALGVVRQIAQQQGLVASISVPRSGR